MTLPHEHVFLSLMREHRATGLLHDPELMARELGRFLDAGGSSWSIAPTWASVASRRCCDKSQRPQD